MEWSDQGIILAIEKYNEQSAVLSCLTLKRGLCRGFIKNIKSKSNHKTIFIGNIVHLSWVARLEQHLGSWKILSHETITPYFFHNNKKLASVASICALMNTTLTEQEAQASLFENMIKFLYSIKHDDQWLRNLIFLELKLLECIGFGLDLTQCAATGKTSDLTYISPNTGKAISSDAGKIYHKKLFLLPNFLITNSDEELPTSDLLYVLNVTKHFFEKFLTSQKNLSVPKIRIMLEDILQN
jgi:DNA repair protein RecO (recombination protein O)